MLNSGEPGHSTVPCRNRSSHAVTIEIANAKVDTTMLIG